MHLSQLCVRSNSIGIGGGMHLSQLYICGRETVGWDKSVFWNSSLPSLFPKAPLSPPRFSQTNGAHCIHHQVLLDHQVVFTKSQGYHGYYQGYYQGYRQAAAYSCCFWRGRGRGRGRRGGDGAGAVYRQARCRRRCRCQAQAQARQRAHSQCHRKQVQRVREAGERPRDAAHDHSRLSDSDGGREAR